MYDGGLGSFKVYMMLLHRFQTTRAKPSGIADTLIDFFSFFSQFSFSQQICIGDVTADFSAVELSEQCKRMFRTAADALSARNVTQLLDLERLRRTRENCSMKVSSFLRTTVGAHDGRKRRHLGDGSPKH